MQHIVLCVIYLTHWQLETKVKKVTLFHCCGPFWLWEEKDLHLDLSSYCYYSFFLQPWAVPGRENLQMAVHSNLHLQKDKKKKFNYTLDSIASI